MYEPITLEIETGYGEGKYLSYTINFVGRLIRIVEAGHTTMRLYEWADRGPRPHSIPDFSANFTPAMCRALRFCRVPGEQALPLGSVEPGKEKHRHEDRHRSPRVAP